MEKKMEHEMAKGSIGILAVYVGYIFGVHRDNGKEHGNYYSGLGLGV